MSFTSVIFMFFFLPLFIIGAYLLKKETVSVQNSFLLIASVVFYGWCGLEYVVLLFAEIVVSYLIGSGISRSGNSARVKKTYLIIGVTLNVGVLVTCKYYYFLTGIIQSIVRLVVPKFAIYQPNIPLPLGISFIIFTVIAYLVDVYRGRIDHEHKFADFSLYIFFFPKVVMGPITRYENMQQSIKNRNFSIEAWNQGLTRFCLGFVKKMLLSNKVAVLADAVFAIDGGHNFIIAWAGAIAYTVQIYIDFSSYSDMAIGLSKMAGFDILENFDYPYESAGIQEFWRRWHISLNVWFREYVYIPLGGNRVGKAKLYRNVCIIFFLTGLWHGANWTFIIWGLFHGVFSILERTNWGNVLERLPRVLRHMYTMLIVIIGWVFFRADTLVQGMQYIKSMFTFRLSNLWQIVFWEEITVEFIVFFVIAIFACFSRKRVWIKKEWVRQCGLVICMFLSIYLLLANDFSPFIYLRF